MTFYFFVHIHNTDFVWERKVLFICKTRIFNYDFVTDKLINEYLFGIHTTDNLCQCHSIIPYVFFVCLLYRTFTENIRYLFVFVFFVCVWWSALAMNPGKNKKKSISYRFHLLNMYSSLRTFPCFQTVVIWIITNSASGIIYNILLYFDIIFAVYMNV